MTDINSRQIYFIDKENQKQIGIENYDSDRDILSIKITTSGNRLTDDQIDKDKNWYQQQTIDMDDLHHFVNANVDNKNRFPTHEWKEQYGQYGVHYR